jgi:hypothetical protein
MIRSLVFAAVATIALASTARTEPPAGKPRVADLAWLAGTWRTTEGDKVTEEIWSAPAGGTMIGMFRQVAPGKKSLFELLLIEDDEQGATKRFKHYLTEFKEVEKEPLTLKVAEATKNKVVFPATTEGKLKSSVYEREGDKLKVAVNTTRENKPFQIAITMERVPTK